MKIIMLWIASLTLVACSAKPIHPATEVKALNELQDCEKLVQEIKINESKLGDLEYQKKKAKVGNSFTTAAALLSLNPFALLDNERTGDLNKAIEAKKKYLDELKTLNRQQCIEQE